MGLFNGVVGKHYLSTLSPTLNLQVGDVKSIPLILYKENEINSLVNECINISKDDWDSFEISWEFSVSPLVGGYHTIEESYEKWVSVCEERYSLLKRKEKELNEIFINLYGMQNELENVIYENEIMIYRPNIKKDVQNLISYGVGCMFGRFTAIMDMNGSTVNMDMRIATNNIMIIADEEYLENDIVNGFCEWIKIVYGKDNYETNLKFISDALQCKGETPRDIIRNYFLYDFYNNHCTMYSTTNSGKRPIYWMFESGKQNGFKALIYMHRYNADTIGNLRVDYLHRMERIYENEINRMQDTVDNSSNVREVTAASKRKEKLQKQLKESQEYDAKIGHLALSRIEIDLGDGVKVNYEKIQTASDGKKYQVLAKI